MKQLKRKRLPLNRAIISDILLWLALLLALAYAIYFFGVALPAKRGQVITLRFHNANEISKGSPVRMMGTDIGFVSDLRIQNDYVAVTIQTYPGTLPIPSGAQFNILFTGLAGAKSVEVEVPDSPQPEIDGKPVYLVQEPVRMREVLNASIDVTQALQKGAENITDFFGKKKPVEELQFNIRQAHQMSVVATRHLRHLNQATTDFRQEIQTDTHTAIATLHDLSPGMTEAVSLTSPTTARPELRRFFNNLLRLSVTLNNPRNGVFNPSTLQQRLDRINRFDARISKGAQHLDRKVTSANPTQWMQTKSNQTARAAAAIDRAAKFTAQDYTPALQHSRQQIQSFNQTLIKTNAKLSHHPTNPTPSKP